MPVYAGRKVCTFFKRQKKNKKTGSDLGESDTHCIRFYVIISVIRNPESSFDGLRLQGVLSAGTKIFLFRQIADRQFSYLMVTRDFLRRHCSRALKLTIKC
jgi:hypothetical protein